MIQFDKDNKVTIHKDDLLQLLTSLSVAIWHPHESMMSVQNKYDEWLVKNGLKEAIKDRKTGMHR